MTEYIITIIIGVIQIILSINLIVRKKNIIAILSEILSSLVLLYILSNVSPDVQNISLMHIGLASVEYLCMKFFLVIYMLIARYYSFYVIRAISCGKKKVKASSKKLKFARKFNNVNYWPKLKLGLPGMANKKHPKTGVEFDSKGFPEFKSCYTVKLKKKYFHDTRERHFHMANKILSEDIAFNQKLKLKFTKAQIKKIFQGETPSGYVWHHHQDAGILELVEEEIHVKTGHIGGYSIWGGK